MDNAEAFAVGPYSVRSVASTSSPQAMALYYVYRDGDLVGKSLSKPSIADCEWLERQNLHGTLYASVSTYRKQPLRGRALSRHKAKVRR